MITSLDTGAAPNLPLTGWEGMMGGAGGGDSLQQCAILAHSLMSQQFGARSPEDPEMGAAWEMPSGPMSPMTHSMAQGPHVISPVRGQSYHGQQFPQPQEAPHYHGGQLSPHHDNMSPVMTPVKMPPSPGHPISPEHFSPHHNHVSSSTGHTCHVVSPKKEPVFIDNNPGYYRGQSVAPGPAMAPQWAPELAIQPTGPSYDELSHPPIASSLYGQDLRYNNHYY